MRLIVVLIIILYFCLSGIALAHNPYDPAKAPPQLDNEQSNWWRCSSPNMRQYLARIYGVSEETARNYGAHYDNENRTALPASLTIPAENLGRPASLENPAATLVTVQYKSPPGLTDSQATTWATADPKFKIQLAKIYGISKEIAELYGAKY
jgi:hypothetical protein